jgi:hypothetical protein
MTRADAATLHEALTLFLEVGTGEERDSGMMSDADMQTVWGLRTRIYGLLGYSFERRGDKTQAAYIKGLMEGI